MVAVKMWRISQVVVPVDRRIRSCVIPAILVNEAEAAKRQTDARGNLDRRSSHPGHQIYAAKEDPRTNKDVR